MHILLSENSKLYKLLSDKLHTLQSDNKILHKSLQLHPLPYDHIKSDITTSKQLNNLLFFLI